MPKVARKVRKSKKVKFMVSVDESIADWLADIKAVSGRPRATTINMILKERKRRSHKKLLTR